MYAAYLHFVSSDRQLLKMMAEQPAKLLQVIRDYDRRAEDILSENMDLRAKLNRQKRNAVELRRLRAQNKRLWRVVEDLAAGQARRGGGRARADLRVAGGV